MKTIALFVAAVLLTLPARAQEPVNVSMVGNWSGQFKGVAMPDGWIGGDVTLVVTEQQGPAFKGYAEYQKGSGRARDDFVGAIAMDGRTVTTADSNGYTTGFLLTPDTLEQCYFQSGPGTKVLCGRLRRR